MNPYLDAYWSYAAYYPYLRFASLNRAGADPAALARIDQALERATTLNNLSATAYQLLGGVRVQRGLADQAVPPLQRAVEIQPGLFAARLPLARAYWMLSKKEDALREAKEALDLASTEGECQQAQQLVTQYSR